jgi:hypothetical protein
MEHAKSIVHLSCDPLVLSNVLREATHLETALLYVRGTQKWNFDRMRVSNPAAEMPGGFLGLDEWPATFYVRRAKGPGHSRMNQCE